ncbi:hypothetical protein [Bacillus amyloliquefaciens]|uniref:Integral inner membrane protein n=1 Tax=Bacillus amyloliquefaciens TaxID=1390 RepID=A0AAP7N4C4_BACAM|nr:hypothetical protein [Bacillus amyloliquefaciens]OIK19745.1 hypothetical protein BKP66_15545 [Bacillus amyloliquefaciens]
MLKRFFLVFLTLMMSIFAVLAAAEESSGDHVISFDEPMILLISLGIILCLCLPPLVMSFFGSLIVRIISGVYQCFIVLTFAGLIPIGFLIPNGYLTILVAVAGTLVSSASVAVTLSVGRTKNTRKVRNDTETKLS